MARIRTSTEKAASALQRTPVREAAQMVYRRGHPGPSAPRSSRWTKRSRARTAGPGPRRTRPFTANSCVWGGNARVGRILEMMKDQIRRARLMTLSLRPLPTRSNADHRLVLRAIAAGNAKVAREVHHAHRLRAKKMLIDLLGKHRFHQL